MVFNLLYVVYLARIIIILSELYRCCTPVTITCLVLSKAYMHELFTYMQDLMSSILMMVLIAAPIWLNAAIILGCGHNLYTAMAMAVW